jgi:hypothetical protein
MRKALVPNWSQGRSKNRRDGEIRTRDPLTPERIGGAYWSAARVFYLRTPLNGKLLGALRWSCVVPRWSPARAGDAAMLTVKRQYPEPGVADV